MEPAAAEKLVTTVKSKIRLETTREILKLSFKDAKTKLPEESLILINEVLRSLVLEAALRAAKQTMRDHRTAVELEQIEKILPQLMLDFP